MLQQTWLLLKRDARKIFYLLLAFFVIVFVARLLPKTCLAHASDSFRQVYSWFFGVVTKVFWGLPVLLVLRPKARKWVAFLILVIALELIFWPRLKFGLLLGYLSPAVETHAGFWSGYLLSSFSYALRLIPLFIFWIWFLQKEGYKQTISRGLLKAFVFLLLLAIWDIIGATLHCDFIVTIREMSNPLLWGFLHTPLFGALQPTIFFAGLVLTIYFLTGWAKNEKERPQKTPKKAVEKK